MRIAMSLVIVALLASACSKKDDATKSPDTAKAPETTTAIPAELADGPKPGKWRMTTVIASMPKPITMDVCLPKTSFKEMQTAQQQSGVKCSEQTMTRQGADNVGHAVCEHPGGKMTVDSRFSGDLNTRYTTESKTIMDPAPTPAIKEMTMKITAERLGDC